jgi:hypothetical protein
MTSEPVIDELRSLLNRERQVILMGTLADLSDIAAAKHAILDVIDAGTLQIGELQADLQRNQTLLRAAINGLSEAAVRISELRQSRDGFRPYDSQGLRATTTAKPPLMERKA